MTVAAIAAPGASRSKASWIKRLLLAAAVAAGWWGVSSFDYERYLSLNVLTQWLHDAGPLAPLLLIGSMATAVVIPPIPSLPLDLAAGAAFGPFYGALYAVAGAEIGAIACFLIARALGRNPLSRFLKTETTFCRMCTDRQLMGVMFLARLIPVFSFDVVSYGAGLTNISLKTFALATLFGMAPPTLAFAYLGSSVLSARWPFIAAGVAMVLFFLSIPALLSKYRASRIACLLLGPPTAQAPASPTAGTRPAITCSGCGAGLPET
jgi:uncharacterized membrane protein YdjX (TVP38/TMEM64 family)